MNPYCDQNFFTFFTTLAYRIGAFLSGKFPASQLASDELQLALLICLSLSGALVGTFLILRSMAMLANALSHTILLGIVITYLFFGSLALPNLMVAAIATGLTTSFLTQFLSKTAKLQEDASIGIIFSLFFALGILLLTLFSRNVHLGTELVMGNIDALQKNDLYMVAFVLLLNGLIFSLFYYGFKITTFDPHLAKVLGFSPLFFNYFLMVQTAATAISSFRAVGVLMVMAFFVLPPLTARHFTDRISRILLLSFAIGILSAFIGVALSRHLLSYLGVGLSTGGLVVVILGLFYFLSTMFNKKYSHCSRL